MPKAGTGPTRLTRPGPTSAPTAAAPTMTESVSPRENARNRSGTRRWRVSVATHSTTVDAAPARASGATAAAAPGTTPARSRPEPVTRSDPRSATARRRSGAARAPKPSAAVATPKPRSPACQWSALSRRSATAAAESTKFTRATSPIAAGTPGTASTTRSRCPEPDRPSPDRAGAGAGPRPASRPKEAAPSTTATGSDQRPWPAPRSTPPRAGPTTNAVTSAVTSHVVHRSVRCGASRGSAATAAG